MRGDLPAHRLRRGDVAIVVECHASHPGQERGYTLEVFTATGETIAVGARISNRAAHFDGSPERPRAAIGRVNNMAISPEWHSLKGEIG